MLGRLAVSKGSGNGSMPYFKRVLHTSRSVRSADLSPKGRSYGAINDRYWSYRNMSKRGVLPFDRKLAAVAWTATFTWVFYRSYYDFWHMLGYAFPWDDIKRLSDSYLGIPQDDQEIIRGAPEKWRRKWGYSADGEKLDHPY